MYNYAKIEAQVLESDINDCILDATYILSTIKYNGDVIKLVLNEDYFRNKESVHDIFIPKEVTSDFLEYNDDIESGDDVNGSIR